MGSPVGPLLANVFMCSTEETLEREGKMPTYYRRFVDDTLGPLCRTKHQQTISSRFSTSVIPLLSSPWRRRAITCFPFWAPSCSTNIHIMVETKIYVQPTNAGLLLHYKSHVDDRYKRGLLKTALDRAFRLSSNWRYFSEECDRSTEVIIFST